MMTIALMRNWLIPMLVIVLLSGLYLLGHSNGKNAAMAVCEKREQAAVSAQNAALKAANAAAYAADKRYASLEKQVSLEALKNAKTIDDYRNRLAAAGRLRDPGASAASRCKLPTTATDTAAAVDDATSGELSEAFDGFLKQQAYEADQAAVYAGACHDWAMRLSQP